MQQVGNRLFPGRNVFVAYGLIHGIVFVVVISGRLDSTAHQQRFFFVIPGRLFATAFVTRGLRAARSFVPRAIPPATRSTMPTTFRLIRGFFWRVCGRRRDLIDAGIRFRIGRFRTGGVVVFPFVAGYCRRGC
jgi:hypothetical protein